MTQSPDLSPFPAGWYALAATDDVPPGTVLTRTFFGREVVLYRTMGGDVRVVDAHCPHLGAHLGKGGTVRGEHLRCPFHGFEFDGTGRCAQAYEGQKGTIKSRLETLPVLNRNGWILVWGDTDRRTPWFEPPEVDTSDWSALTVHEWRLRSHPQETTENSVDTGHFTEVHGYTSVSTVSEMTADGAHLTATYQMVRPNPFLRWLAPIRNQFKVTVWGLGYSQVDISVENYGLQMRMFVMPQPTDGEHIVLRVGMSTRNLRSTHGAWTQAVPAGLITALINRQAGLEAASDVADDFDVWNHKIYVAPPSLARGDGPIGRYRVYCRQFYDNASNEDRRAAAS